MFYIQTHSPACSYGGEYWQEDSVRVNSEVEMIGYIAGKETRSGTDSEICNS